MSYAGERRIHDADSHVMETPGWLSGYADPVIRVRLTEIDLNGTAPGEHERIERTRADHHDRAYREDDASQLMLRKNWAATGSFLAEDRPAALDLLGFASQLVFNTFASGVLAAAEQKGDHDLDARVLISDLFVCGECPTGRIAEWVRRQRKQSESPPRNATMQRRRRS